MIDSLATLLTAMLSIQAAMTTYTLPIGRSWALQVRTTVTDATLLANPPLCCEYLRHADGTIVRAGSSGTHLFLVRVR